MSNKYARAPPKTNSQDPANRWQETYVSLILKKGY